MATDKYSYNYQAECRLTVKGRLERVHVRYNPQEGHCKYRSGHYCIVARAFDNEGNMNWSNSFVSNILNTNVSVAPNASIPGKPSFVPRLIIVGIGDTVSWTNNDTVPHIVTSSEPRIAEPDLKFKSGLLEPDRVFEHTFAHAGSYQYYCAIHPFMTVEVVVT